MYRFFSSILVLFFAASAFAQTDSTDTEGTSAILPKQQQLRIGFDISKPIFNALSKTKQSYEFTVDYCLPKEIYLVAEGGFGGANIDYADLKYSSSNTFFRVGIDKSMLQRLFPNDWDFLFVGIRYGVAIINRSEATYLTSDPVWGTTTGTIASKSFSGHWAELTAGLRVELFRGFFIRFVENFYSINLHFANCHPHL
ncbi:MAG TPA: DUF6048 family protein [Flavipsychrobacter sp.]|nr:DUF6048 family protein [Flavipsychrobacter sp.]